jgi:hypothetical protein
MKELTDVPFEALVDQSIMLYWGRMNLMAWTQGPEVGIYDHVRARDFSSENMDIV